jgi:filamentous hemagglutinin family protein
LIDGKNTVQTPNVTILNDNGIYIGNNQFVTEDMLVKVFDKIKDRW